MPNERVRAVPADRVRKWLWQTDIVLRISRVRRGGKGIAAITVSKRNGQVIASFPVEDGDDIMLVSDGGS
jgi:DNA gyrase/topoisomerase IV subunit A